MQHVCPTCGERIARVGQHDHRPSSHQRGLGAEHRRIRAEVLAEETACWICGGQGTTADPSRPTTSYPVPQAARPCVRTIAPRTDHAIDDAEQQRDEPHPNLSKPSSPLSDDSIRAC